MSARSSRGRHVTRISLLVLFAAGLTCARPEAQNVLDVDAAFARSQAAVGTSVRDQVLRDGEGRNVTLAGLRGKPMLISMIYTSCPDTCPLITTQLTELVEVARDAVGKESFRVLTVGFDAGVDTPARMRSYARGQGVDGDPDWQFLSADAAAIEALTEDLGFSYAPSARGFDHLAQVTVLDAEQRVYRQVYGDTLTAPSLVEPLKELVFGDAAGASTLQGWIDGVRLLCTVYDPASGRYSFDYSVFVSAVIGAACLGWLAYFLFGAWRQHRRPPAI